MVEKQKNKWFVRLRDDLTVKNQKKTRNLLISTSATLTIRALIANCKNFSYFKIRIGSTKQISSELKLYLWEN